MAFPNGLSGGDRSEDHSHFSTSRTSLDERPLAFWGGSISSAQLPTQALAQNQPSSRFQVPSQISTQNQFQPRPRPYPRRLTEGSDLPSILDNTTTHRAFDLQQTKLNYSHIDNDLERYGRAIEYLQNQQHLAQEKKRELELAAGIEQMDLGSHPQSEPTTPPEYRTFNTNFSPKVSSGRANRHSTSYMASNSYIGSSRTSRAGSNLASPPSGLMEPFVGPTGLQSSTPNDYPSQSFPTSRRNSDEEFDGRQIQVDDQVNHRSAAALNRNSMPATGAKYYGNRTMPALDSMLSLGQINTTGFLFGDEEASEKPTSKRSRASATASDIKSYLQLHETDDKFPVLLKRNGFGGQLSASSATIGTDSPSDLEGSWLPALDSQSRGPPKGRPTGHFKQSQSISGTNVFTSKADFPGPMAPRESRAANRYSLDTKLTSYPETLKAAFLPDSTNNSSSNDVAASGPPKLQPSYSTNDLPTLQTVKNINNRNTYQPASSRSSFINHNANLGRIPAKAFEARHSREPSIAADYGQTVSNGFDGAQGGENKNVNLNLVSPKSGNRRSQDFMDFATESAAHNSLEGRASMTQENRSGLKPNAAPFGPVNGSGFGVNLDGAPSVFHTTTPTHVNPPNIGARQQPWIQPHQNRHINSTAIGSFNPHANSQMGIPVNSQFLPYVNMYGNYNGNAFGQQPAQFPNGYNVYSGVQQMNGPGRLRDSQTQVMWQRRQGDVTDAQRYANVQLSQLSGQMLHVTKDQHGCRYLQKKLDERNPEDFNMIFNEIAPNMIDLMMDPFGNYLCQKLFECSNNEQKTHLIEKSAPELLTIALNQHGTRALQKMIECLSTRQQIDILIDTLKSKVVVMIQDLNGNHVIQKCLNHLKSEDTQWIFDSVSMNILVIGTHRHGCCVIQRCLDHSTLRQKSQIVEAVSTHSFALNRDPFGNYVTQYILDVDEPALSERMMNTFRGSVIALSKSKFSSNVIEKSLRVSAPHIRRWLLEEMLRPLEIERLVKDQFGNYVVQTAMEKAPEDLEPIIVERVRAALVSVKGTPHGRRIQAKIAARDQAILNALNGMSTSALQSGNITPASLAASTSHPSGNITPADLVSNSRRQSRPSSRPMSRHSSRPSSSATQSRRNSGVNGPNWRSGGSGSNSSVASPHIGPNRPTAPAANIYNGPRNMAPTANIPPGPLFPNGMVNNGIPANAVYNGFNQGPDLSVQAPAPRMNPQMYPPFFNHGMSSITPPHGDSGAGAGSAQFF